MSFPFSLQDDGCLIYRHTTSLDLLPLAEILLCGSILRSSAKSRDRVDAWSLRRSLLEKLVRGPCHSAIKCALKILEAVET